MSFRSDRSVSFANRRDEELGTLLSSPLSVRCESCGSLATTPEPSAWRPSARLEVVKYLVSVRCCAFLAVVMTVVMLTSALFLPQFFNMVLEQKIRETLVVDSTQSPGYPEFVSNAGAKDKILLRVHVLDIVNREEVLNGAEPAVNEVGPFVYEVRIDRFNISFEEEGELVFSRNWQWYKFLPELSVGSDTETQVTTVNLPFLAVYYLVIRNLPPLVRDAAMQYAYKHASDQSAFVTLSVHDLLFGYFDPNLPAPEKEPSPGNVSLALLHDSRHTPTGRMKNFPGLVRNISSFEEFNSTVLRSSIHTGKFIPDMIHAMHTVNGMEYLETCLEQTCPPAKKVPLWETSEANLVQGSDGEYFPTERIKNRDPLMLWVGPLMSKFWLTPSSTNGSEVTEVDRIKTIEYVLPASAFANSTVNPANAALYMNGKNGLFNFSRQAMNIPISVSKPHFLDADESLLEGVKGLAPPSRQSHETRLLLHEPTGIPIRLFQRFQFNVDIGPLNVGLFSRYLAGVTPTTVPIFWIEIAEQLSDKHKELFQSCDFAKQVVQDIHIASYGLGSVALLTAIVMSVVHTTRSKRMELRRRRSGLYQALLVETGDQSPYFLNNWVDREHVMRHPHLQRAVFFTCMSAFMVNMAVELLLFRKQSQIGLIQAVPGGSSSIIAQIWMTVSLLAFFVTLGSCADAKKSVEMGAFPSLFWPALSNKQEIQLESLDTTSGWDLWRFFLTPTRRVERFISLAFCNAVWYACLFGPLPTTIVLILRYCAKMNAVDVLTFTFVKASYAALEAACVFIPVYLKVASSPHAPLHEYLSQESFGFSDCQEDSDCGDEHGYAARTVSDTVQQKRAIREESTSESTLAPSA